MDGPAILIWRERGYNLGDDIRVREALYDQLAQGNTEA